MIAALAGIFLCQLLGETFTRLFALPLPGPVLGMGLMFGYLLFRGRDTKGQRAIPPGIATAADGLLGHLSLLFVPVTVGLMRFFDLLRANAATIATVLVVSTVLTMAVTAGVFHLLSRVDNGDRT